MLVKTRTVAVAGVVGFWLTSAGARAEESSRLRIQVVDHSALSGAALIEAQHIVQQAFGASGIGTTWSEVRPGGTPPDESDVTILLLSREMTARHTADGGVPGSALASAVPRPGMRAWIYSDRVVDQAGLLGCSVGALLGQVISHEIGHVIAGLPHSSRGMMRGSVRRPIDEVVYGFTASEAALLRSALVEADFGSRRQPQITQSADRTR